MTIPVAGAVIDLPFKEEARVVPRVAKRNQQEVHRLWTASGIEGEGWEQCDRAAALFQEDGRLMHRPERRK